LALPHGRVNFAVGWLLYRLQREPDMSRRSDYIRRLIQPKVIVFAVSLVAVIVAHISVARWYRQFGNSPGDWFPDNWIHVPYVLLFAATMLLIARWWSYILAILVSLWVTYSLGYGGLLSHSRVQDRSFFSFGTVRAWFFEKYNWQPQELVQVGLAVVVLTFGVLGLVRTLRHFSAASDGI
jgi:cation transport ATPase